MFSWNVLTNVLQPPPILSRSWGQAQSRRHAGLELDHTDIQGAGTYLAFLICLGEAPLWGEHRHFSDGPSSASAGTKPYTKQSHNPYASFPPRASLFPKSRWPKYGAPGGASETFKKG